MKKFLEKHREIVRYLFFGVTTTLVGWAVYFGVLMLGKAALGIDTEQTGGGEYFAIYTVAQVTQWVASVLVAFFTNKKWVFTEADKERSTLAQLTVFAGGRVLTFLLDYAITYFGTLALSAILPMLNSVTLIGREWNVNEIAAKLISAVLVIIGNYVFSKLFVFKTKKQK